MPNVLFKISAPNLYQKTASETGGNPVVFEEIKNLIIEKMNSMAEVVKEAYQSMAPIRTQVLKNAIFVVPATSQHPVAEVAVVDNVHWSFSNSKHTGLQMSRQLAEASKWLPRTTQPKEGSRAKPREYIPKDFSVRGQVTQEDIERVRVKARQEYDSKLRDEIHARKVEAAKLDAHMAASSRAAAADQFFARKRERVRLNAGAYALTNIELAYLLESGGQMARRVSLPHQVMSRTEKVGPSHTFVSFGREGMSEMEAFSTLATTFAGKAGMTESKNIQNTVSKLVQRKKKQLSKQFENFKKKMAKVYENKIAEREKDIQKFEEAINEFEMRTRQLHVYNTYTKMKRIPKSQGLPSENKWEGNRIIRSWAEVWEGSKGTYPSIPEHEKYMDITKLKMLRHEAIKKLEPEIFEKHGVEKGIEILKSAKEGSYNVEFVQQRKHVYDWEIPVQRKKELEQRKTRLEELKREYQKQLSEKSENHNMALSELKSRTQKELEENLSKQRFETAKRLMSPGEDEEITRRARTIHEREQLGALERDLSSKGHTVKFSGSLGSHTGSQSYFVRSQTNPGFGRFSGRGGQKGTPTENWMELAQEMCTTEIDRIMEELTDSIGPKISEAVNKSFTELESASERWIRTDIPTGIKPERYIR